MDIILPCFNPGPGWEKILIDSYFNLQNAIPNRNLNIILVNDGSTVNVNEASYIKLKDAIKNITFISYNSNKGKGYALREGVKVSKSDYLILTDIDFPYDTNSYLELENSLTKNNGIAAGIRSSEYYEHVPMFRKVLSKTFRLAIKIFYGLDKLDSQCGLKGFDKQSKKYFLKTQINRYLFDLEFLVLTKKNVAISNVPVQLKSGVKFSTMGTKIIFTEFINFIKIAFIKLKE